MVHPFAGGSRLDDDPLQPPGIDVTAEHTMSARGSRAELRSVNVRSPDPDYIGLAQGRPDDRSRTET